jgi:protein-S-isoprenylcysteine O-methyltransferase Ste14
MSLKLRLAMRMALVLPIVAAVLFVPAGSLRFWQAWVFVGLFVGFNAFFAWYFLRRDPDLIERRLKGKEQKHEQKRFQVFWLPLWLATLMLPGFDFRFGWSKALAGGVPVWLSVIAQAAVALSWGGIFVVFRYNSFASTVVKVEEGQKVVSEGPYRLVRHPMYSGLVLMMAAAGLALGSYVAVVPALLKIPLLVYRLKHEELLLRKELPGYEAYCEKTRWRLVPGVY